RGRISAADMGIWKDEHVDFLARITGFVSQCGAIPGIQLAHAGRKASTRPPFHGGGTLPEDQGGWRPAAPSPVPFNPGDAPPAELGRSEIRSIVDAFSSAAGRALRAGFELVEIHAAHGYLIHEFLSPLSNRRTDEYGGSFDNRIRFPLDTVEAVRAVWPNQSPLFVRLSATDWVEGGWDVEQTIELARRLSVMGVDLID